MANPVLRALRRLPPHLVNGIEVALGIVAVQLLLMAAAGAHAAQMATAGALCASLPDMPGTLRRNRGQVLAGALAATAAALCVAVLQPFPAALGAGIGVVSFVAMMAMAWGPRAGPVAFAAVISLVFSMAVPPDPAAPWAQTGWTACGAATYLLWSQLATAVLQSRYRRLALAAALDSAATLLAARAELLRGTPASAEESASMRAWIDGEAVVSERLQTARDLLFTAPDTPAVRRMTAALLELIDLRDALLSARLDLGLLGGDAAGGAIRRHFADSLQAMSQQLVVAAVAVREGGTPAAGPVKRPAAPALPPADARQQLVQALSHRLQNLAAIVQRLQAHLANAHDPQPLTRDELQLFVSPDNWPLAALRSHASLQSPVLRHAVRVGLALGSAYYVARLLPWASHPHWLVLSVAVVLRSSLGQTLARRNARVGGTLIGCMVVLGLAHVPWPGVQSAALVAAVGLAHSFATVRYVVTASAGTVMALLQAHLAQPAAGFAIAERVADTLLGVALAWAFSYVLPSWERRSLPGTIDRLLRALAECGRLSLAPGDDTMVAQRLARRRAYDALSAARTVHDSSAMEPTRVRLPLRELGALVDHAYQLMAHLSMLRLALNQRRAEFDVAPVRDALQATGAVLQALPCASGDALDDGPGGRLDLLEALPVTTPAEDAIPWLLRRLQVTASDASAVQRAAAATLQALAHQGAAHARH